MEVRVHPLRETCFELTTDARQADRRRLFVFDMDGTLLPDTSGLLAVAAVLDTLREVEELEREFARGKVSTVEFTRAVYAMWGLVPSTLSRSAFESCRKMTEIREVTADISAGGGISCLITMSQDFFANHFLEYGFDYVFSSRYPAVTDGAVQEADVLVPESKPGIVRELCERYEFNFETTIAFGDSGSDVPLFRELIHTISVNASERLEKMSSVNYRGSSMMTAYQLALDAVQSKETDMS